MTELVIKPCTVKDIEDAPNFQELHDAYASELVVDGAPPFDAKAELYYQLEKTHNFQIFGAYIDNVLIGFVNVLLTVLPHVGVMMAVTESLFVLKRYRKSYAGMKLIKVAKKYAKLRGAPCLLISAPHGGDLARVLPILGGKHTSDVFLMGLDDV